MVSVSFTDHRAIGSSTSRSVDSACENNSMGLLVDECAESKYGSECQASQTNSPSLNDDLLSENAEGNLDSAAADEHRKIRIV